MNEYRILKDLVNFNTIKDKENKEIIDYIEKFLKNLNFKTEYKGKYLIMSIGKNPKIGFLGHTDTVEYIDGWQSNPFELTIKGNYIYGLGVADMKGGIAAILDAVSKIDFSNLEYGMKLYFTYDEEITFGGIYDILKTNEKFPKVMIFGEPTNNELLVGSKGLLEYKLDFKGIKVHSSNPEKGKSANMNAIKFFAELDEFYNKNIRPFEDKNFEIPYTTMNVGVIKGGSAMNSVSAECTATLDFRAVNTGHIAIIKDKVEELGKKYDCDITIVDEVEPFIDENIFGKEIKTANFLTEANVIKGSNRIILGTGPVTAHEINEHITKESYNNLVEQYVEIIKDICK